MSLDFAIVDDGKPKSSVPLSVELHYEFIKNAAENNMDYIMNVSDYYSDYEFHINELPILLHQVEFVYTSQISNKLRSFLKKLIFLIKQAIQKNVTIYVIAD